MAVSSIKLRHVIYSHNERLKIFEHWCEKNIDLIRTLLNEVWLTEQLILHAQPGDLYHTYAPIILAVTYAIGGDKVTQWTELAETEGEDKINLPFQIFAGIRESFFLAARACLKSNDSSRIVRRQGEYAKMTAEELRRAQSEMHMRILSFFCSAQHEVYSPRKNLVDEIAIKMAQITAKSSSAKVKRVSFRFPSGKSRKGKPPNGEIGEVIRSRAKVHATHLELIKENEADLKCFFVKGSSRLVCQSADHLSPSKLISQLLSVTFDNVWEYFYQDHQLTRRHLALIENEIARTLRLSDATKLEVVRRYRNINKVEETFLDDMVWSIRKASCIVAERFASSCKCGEICHIRISKT